MSTGFMFLICSISLTKSCQAGILRGPRKKALEKKRPRRIKFDRARGRSGFPLPFRRAVIFRLHCGEATKSQRCGSCGSARCAVKSGGVMLPSFADFESQTRLNEEMLRLFAGFVKKNATSVKSHFIFPASYRHASMFHICSWLRNALSHHAAA